MVNGVEQLGSNERNTLGIHGSVAIEMLAREMTETLQVQAENLPDGHHTIRAKGVDFDVTIADGQVVASDWTPSSSSRASCGTSEIPRLMVTVVT